MGTEKRARQKANRELGRQQAVKDETRRRYTRIAIIAVAALAVLIGGVWVASSLLGGDDDPTPSSVPGDTVPAGTLPDDTVPATTPADDPTPTTEA